MRAGRKSSSPGKELQFHIPLRNPRCSPYLTGKISGRIGRKVEGLNLIPMQSVRQLVVLARERNLRVGHSNLFAFPISFEVPLSLCYDAGLSFLLIAQLDEAVTGKDLLLDP
jgi:hypothetical protein